MIIFTLLDRHANIEGTMSANRDIYVSTISVKGYEKLIEEGIHQPTDGEYKPIKRGSSPYGGIFAFTNRVEPLDHSRLLFVGINKAVSKYVKDARIEQDKSCGNIRRHLGIVENIQLAQGLFQKEQTEKKSRKDCIREVADEITRLLHYGVQSGFNPKGNFANLCRAIVNKTREDDAWVFTWEFTEALGLKPSVAVASPRSM